MLRQIRSFVNSNLGVATQSTNTTDDRTSALEFSTDMAELEIILACVDRPLQLSDLVEAGELIYINQAFHDIIKTIIVNYSSTRDFPSLIKTCFIPIMYLLKRHQNLNDFIDTLLYHYSEITDLTIEFEFSLRQIFHALLLNSDFSLSRTLLILLSKRNPVPFVHPCISSPTSTASSTYYEFISDIIHVWDYSIPTILSFGIGACQGKSTLLNKLFLSSFEQSRSSIYFENTIDIDFGYNFTPRRATNIADTHGAIKRTLLEQIHQLFDGFLIHVEYKYLVDHVEEVISLINLVTYEDKYRLLIIRDVPPTSQNQLTELLSNRFPAMKTSTLPKIAEDSTANKNRIISLQKQIWETIPIPTTCRHDATYLITKLKQIIHPQYKEHLDQIHGIIDPLEKQLVSIAKDGTLSKKYFSQYLQFSDLCQLILQLANFRFYGNANDAEVYQLRRQMFEMEENLSNSMKNSNEIFQFFFDILNAPNKFTCLDLLSTHLKQDRAKSVPVSDMAKQLPLHQSLSLEILWRNAILCSQSSPSDKQEFLHQQYYQYIKAGFPFEIIDGDNLYFQYEFLLQTLSALRDQRTLVISIIGPQNSGKSTLLNYMFGTLFDVRSGRCTRGIYGSFIKCNQPNFDHILLLDTEGLFGIERKDEHYDRRIVLFCLAVSHLVLINVIGELNTGLEDIVLLCVDSLNKMGVTRIPQPIVHVILNQQADLNVANHNAMIDGLIKRMNSHVPDKLVNLLPDNFHALPSAFKKEGKTLTSSAQLSSAVHTTPEFLDCAHNLCKEILQSSKQCQDGSIAFSDPLQWLSSSRTIFETAQEYPDLTHYQDIHERRIDKDIREHTRKYLLQIFSTDYRQKLIAESTKKTKEDIDHLFAIRKQQVDDKSREDLQKILKMLKASNRIRERSEIFLQIQINEIFNGLKTTAIAMNEREKVKALVQTAQASTQMFLEEIMDKKQSKPLESVLAEFDKKFNEQTSSISRQFVPETRLEQAITHIYINYNIYEKECIVKDSIITGHFSFLHELNRKAMSMNTIEEKYTDYFISQRDKSSLVDAGPFNPKIPIYSLDMIDKLVYLNKNILQREFHKFIAKKDYNPTMMGCTDPFLITIRNTFQTERQNDRICDGERYFGLTRSFQELLRRVIQAMQGTVQNEVRQIGPELIQRIVGLVNSLIGEIDQELSPFCVSTTRPLKSAFHSCAIVLLSKYYYDEQWNYFHGTLSELKTQQVEIREIIRTIIEQNASVDENYAINFVQQYKDYLIERVTKEGQDIITTEMKKHDSVNRKHIQDLCDEQLLSNNDDEWFEDYLENPTKIIEERFQRLWENIEQEINQKIMDRKSYYAGVLRDSFNCFQGFWNTLCASAPVARAANDLFTTDQMNTLTKEEHLINKKIYLNTLFYQYVIETDISAFFNIAKVRYTLKKEALVAFQSLATKKQSSNSSNSLSQGLTQEKDRILKEWSERKMNFTSLDKDDTYAKLRDKVRGCFDVCPCCKRPCDVDHTQFQSKPGATYNEHQCKSGHTFRAMNGYKFEVTNEPSLMMCEQIKDDQILVINSIRYQWSQFKLEHPEWNFKSDLSNKELDRLHGKFLVLWEKLGLRICQKYNMTFVTHNTHFDTHFESLHYILLLDGSGSMAGVRWKNLIEAVDEFIKTRRQLQVNDRVTIIVFSSSAELYCSNQDMQQVNLDGLREHKPSDRTSFKKAFDFVNTCIDNTKRQFGLDTVHNQYAIIFMSDGEGDYPTDELDKLCDEHSQVIRKFWTLALTEEPDSWEILEEINKKMKGSFYDIETSAKLISVYAEVATSHVNVSTAIAQPARR